LKGEQAVISLIIPEAEGEVLIASENGYGKRSAIADYSVIGRGGQGVIGMKLSERNGAVVGAIQIFSGDEVMLISDQGTLVRTRSEEVSVQGRNTQGVRLINLGGDEHLVGLARVEEPAEDEEDLASDDEAVERRSAEESSDSAGNDESAGETDSP